MSSVCVCQRRQRGATDETCFTFCREQDFENYVAIKDYSNAIRLALSMEQPKRLLRLLTEVRTVSPEMTTSYTGSRAVDTVIRDLTAVELRQLLLYIKDWNAVARTSEVAQGVLFAVFKFYDVERVLEALEPPKPDEGDQDEGMQPGSDDEEEDEQARRERLRKQRERRRKQVDMKAQDVLQALIPYTERHMTRTDKLVRESFIVEHLLSQMASFEDVADDEMDIDKVGR